MNWCYRLCIMFCTLHILISVVYNLAHLGDQETEASTSKKALLDRLHVRLHSLALLPHYAQWTGIHGGYSFYSPSVGSSYYSHYNIDTEGEHKHHQTHPLLRSRSAKVRYRSFMDIQQVWINARDSSTKADTLFAHAINRSLTQRLARHYPATTVRHHILVLFVPSLQEQKKNTGQEKKLVNLVEYSHRYDKAPTENNDHTAQGYRFDFELGDGSTLAGSIPTLRSRRYHRPTVATATTYGLRLGYTTSAILPLMGHPRRYTPAICHHPLLYSAMPRYGMGISCPDSLFYTAHTPPRAVGQ